MLDKRIPRQETYCDWFGSSLDLFGDGLNDGLDRGLKKFGHCRSVMVHINMQSTIFSGTYPGILSCPALMSNAGSLSLMLPNLTKAGSSDLRK